MFELSVKIKDSESTYRRDFVVHDEAKVDQDDPIINECVLIAIKEFGRHPESVSIKIQMEVV